MKLVRVWSIILFCMARVDIYLAQMIIMTRWCVACKNHVTRSVVKVTVCTLTVCIGFSKTCSCPAHNFVIHGMISKLSGLNNYDNKAMCRVPRLKVKVTLRN